MKCENQWSHRISNALDTMDPTQRFHCDGCQLFIIARPAGPGRWLLMQFLAFRSVPDFNHCQITGYLLSITLIFGMCRRRSIAMTLVEYK